MFYQKNDYAQNSLLRKRQNTLRSNWLTVLVTSQDAFRRDIQILFILLSYFNYN